jgi:hypothetical protein
LSPPWGSSVEAGSSRMEIHRIIRREATPDIHPAWWLSSE